MRNAAIVAILADGLMMTACSESPKIEPAKTEPVKMKMTTTVPPGIASPDKVETHLGTLRFFDGFPDDASVEKLYDNLDFQRSVQAYLLALAPVSQVANRKGILEVGPPTPPAGKENNWVQTIPGKGWNNLPRLYGPLQRWQQWQKREKNSWLSISPD